MDTLPRRVLDTADDSFFDLNTATARGQVMDIGFACISYIWKEEGEDKSTPVVNGEIYPVPKSIKRNVIGSSKYAASMGIKYIWIDALCINQHDPEEITEEISKMYTYFTVCDLVIVWIAKNTFTGAIDQSPDKAINQLYESEWLKRSWTMQEGVLANRLVVATDWGIFFPDALYRRYVQENNMPIETPQEFRTLLISRHKRSLIGSEVIELSQGRSASVTADRVKSLSALLPYTRNISFPGYEAIDAAENIYLDALFASKDISPLCCILSENEIRNNTWKDFLFLNKNKIKNSTWTWKLDFLQCYFPSNVRMCMYKASRPPKITVNGLRIDAKMVRCVASPRYIANISWRLDFPEGHGFFNEHSGVTLNENGFLILEDELDAKTIEEFLLQGTNQKFNKNIRVVMMDVGRNRRVRPSLVFLDKIQDGSSYKAADLCTLLPGIVASGCEVGILVRKEKQHFCRIGLSFMSQIVMLETMSVALTEVLLK